MSVVVGIDIGGSKIRASVQDRVGNVLATSQAPTPPEGAEGVVDRCVSLIAELGVTDAIACGIGTAGAVDTMTGRIVWSTSAIGGWFGFPLGERLALRLGIPVLVENDVNALAYAEATRGAAAGAASTLAVVIGTGIGGGFVEGTRVWRGVHFRALEIGHTFARGADEAPCACGRSGHIEAVASAAGIERAWNARGRPLRSLRDLVAAAAAGDADAQILLNASGVRLGEWLPSMVAAFDPEVVVIGGGVARSPDYRAGIDVGFEAARDTGPAPLLKDAALGENAVAIGAAQLAWARLEGRGP